MRSRQVFAVLSALLARGGLVAQLQCRCVVHGSDAFRVRGASGEPFRNMNVTKSCPQRTGGRQRAFLAAVLKRQIEQSRFGARPMRGISHLKEMSWKERSVESTGQYRKVKR